MGIYMLQIKQDLQKIHSNRLTILVALITFITFSLYTLVLLPLYLTLNSNIIYQSGLIVSILLYAMKTLELIGMLASYGIIIYSLYVTDLKSTIKISAVFLGVTLYKYITNLLVSWFMSGGIPANFISDMSFTSFLISLALETLKLAFIVFISFKIKSSAKKRMYYTHTTEADDIDAEDDIHSFSFPLRKIFNKKNPVQVSILICAILFMVEKIIQYLRFYIYYQLGSVPVYLVMFVSELVLAVIMYFFILYILITLDNLTMKYTAKLNIANENNYIEKLK